MGSDSIEEEGKELRRKLEARLRSYHIDELEMRVKEVAEFSFYVEQAKTDAYKEAAKIVEQEQAEQGYDEHTVEWRMQAEEIGLLQDAFVGLYMDSVENLYFGEYTLWYHEVESVFSASKGDREDHVKEEYVVEAYDVPGVEEPQEEDNVIARIDEAWEEIREKLSGEQVSTIERTIRRKTEIAAEYLEIQRGDLYLQLFYAISFSVLEELYERINEKIITYVQEGITFHEPTDDYLWKLVRKEFNHLKGEGSP